jgi:hypothetical protein
LEQSLRRICKERIWSDYYIKKADSQDTEPDSS